MPRTLSGYCNSIASMAASKDQDPSQVLRVYAFFHWTSSANLYEPCPPLVVLPQAWYSAPLVRNDILPRELAMLNWKVKRCD